MRLEAYPGSTSRRCANAHSLNPVQDSHMLARHRSVARIELKTGRPDKTERCDQCGVVQDSHPLA